MKRLALGIDHQLLNMAGAVWRRGRPCVDDRRVDMRGRPWATSDHNARAPGLPAARASSRQWKSSRA
jgi:hypothetical protein